MLVLIGVSAVGELVAAAFLRGWAQKLTAAVALLVVAFACGGLAFARWNVATVLVSLFGAYRTINLLRLVEARTNETYLRRATERTAIWLIGFQTLTLTAWWAERRHPVSVYTLLATLAGLQLVVATVLLLSTIRHLRTTRPQGVKVKVADKDLPTISVAVPARNEDQQLEECLRSILSSDYPKLEVIVLDDCSQDKTSNIVRRFAHDGVRFVLGQEPKPNWLAKNQAYARLAAETSGDIVLFCGVDIRFEPRTVRQLVNTLNKRQKAMLSVLPCNNQRTLSLPQSMRYMWELALPRRLFNRPPVLSSCWLIRREALERSGGFAAVSRAITPEAYFARRSAKQNDGYSFLRSSPQLGLISVKSLREQRATAIRTRYPQLHRRLEFASLLSLAELVLLIGPFMIASAGIWAVVGLRVELAALAAAFLLVAAYNALTAAAFPRTWWLILISFPFAVLEDIALINYSMWKYEFSEVIWKGRNVCLPVMRTVPSLPEIKHDN